MTVLLIILTFINGGYLTYFLYKNKNDENVYILFGLSWVMLTIRVYGLSLFVETTNKEGEINKWIAENANRVFFWPVSILEFVGLFGVALFTFLLILFYYKGFNARRCKLNLVFCVSVFVISFLFNYWAFSDKIPSNYIEFLIISYAPIIYTLLFYGSFYFIERRKDAKIFEFELSNFEQQFDEIKENIDELKNYINQLKKKSTEIEEWKKHYAIGKAYFGIGYQSDSTFYSIAQSELEQALDIISNNLGINLILDKRFDKYVEPTYKKPIESILATLGFIYYKADDFEKAKVYFRSLYFFSGRDTKYWRLLISLGNTGEYLLGYRLAPLLNRLSKGE